MGLSFLVRLICVSVLLLPVVSAAVPAVAMAENREIHRLERIADGATWIRGFPAEVVEVTTSDGLTLNGLYWPKRDPAKPLVVFFFGWQPGPESVLRQVEPAVRSGYGVLAAVRRGTSGNPGGSGEQHLYDDGQSFTKLARSLAEGGPVILFGYSMGAAVAVEVARREPVTGVVAVGLFTHVADISLPLVSIFVPDPFDSRTAIAGVEVPLVLIYGRDDSIAPAEHGRELFRRATAAPRALVIIEDGGHFLRSSSLLPFVAAAIDAILAGDLGRLHNLPRDSFEVSIAGPGGTAAAGRKEPAAQETSMPEAEGQRPNPAHQSESGNGRRLPAADRR